MKKTLIFFTVSLLFRSFTLWGQVPGVSLSDELNGLYTRLISNTNDQERIGINDSIKSIIVSYIHSPSVFRHNIPDVHHLGQITSPDSLIKIVTWNMALDKHRGRYFCYFIRKRDDGGENMIYDLSVPYDPGPILDDTIYNISDWYGALYYNIRPVNFEGKRSWILLGINFGNPEMTRKVIDVLDFTSDGTLVLGKKWFAEGENMMFRVVLRYSSSAMVSLRFKSDSSIVFDHLVPFSLSEGGRPDYGPDYSFDSYDFNNGIWKFKRNVDVRNKE